jgi:hypothetical protein
MANILENVIQLIERGQVYISDHGYDELAADGLFARDILSSVKSSVIVEEYPDYFKGPCVLVLQKDREDSPVHVVWGIPKGMVSPAVLITAYRPDPKRWENGYLRRKK